MTILIVPLFQISLIYFLKPLLDHLLGGLIGAVRTLKLVHGTEIGATEMSAFDEKVNFGEVALKNLINQYSRKSNSADQVNPAVSDQFVRSNAQMTSSSNPSQASINSNAFDIKKAQVNVEVDSESVTKEVFNLEQELKKYVDWGDASDEEIEEYMGKVELN